MLKLMQTGLPSRTALSAAAHRAAHQVAEGGRIFTDPLALTILGDQADAMVAQMTADPARRGMRLFIAARARFAEDALAAAVGRGVRQLVVLGAGLDTFAYRNPFEVNGLKVFEVDHPATQAWKRRRLADAGLTPPPSLTYTPVDFERSTLGEGLAAGGICGRAAEFLHLGRRRALSDARGGVGNTGLYRRPARRRGGHLRLRRPARNPAGGPAGRAGRARRGGGGGRRAMADLFHIGGAGGRVAGAGVHRDRGPGPGADRGAVLPGRRV